MRLARLLAILLLGFVTLASHANPPAVSNAQPVLSPSMPARLIISRDKSAPNACDVALQVDEQLDTRMPLGETLELQIPAGEIGLQLRLEPTGYCAQIPLQSTQSILIQPGETRYFQLVYRDDALFLAPTTN